MLRSSGVRTFGVRELEEEFHEYDSTWYGRQQHPRTLEYSVFNRYCSRPDAVDAYPDLTTDEHTALIPCLEATIRALDELDWY